MSDNREVSNTATLTQNNLDAPAERKAPGRKPVVTLAIVAAVGAIGVSLWMSMQGANTLQRLNRSQGTIIEDVIPGGDPFPGPTAPTILGEVKVLVRQLSSATATGGIGIIILFSIGLIWFRQKVSQRLIRSEEQIGELQDLIQKTQTDVAQQKTERRRLETELQKVGAEIDRKVEERTAHLSSSHTQLQKELNDRRQAERVMAQQAKELERSKDVLELHVQARTQELQKLQRRYESILNSAGEGIYGLDLQGRTTFVNPATAKITGWKVEELVGKSESEVFHRNGGSGSSPETHADGEPSDHQLFFRKDGTSFPAEYVRTPIREKDKEVGAVVIFKDITERKRAEENLNRKAAELARSNAELEQFAYVASHDLQEPLRKIQAFGDRLKTKCDAVNLQDGRDYLERMQSAAARMQTLINDLLTFSRVISASQPFVPVDLNVVTKGVLSDLEVRIEQQKATVEVADLPTLEGDPLQMRQLLQNLIGNALKFQQPDGHPVVRITGKLLKNPFAGTPEEDPYAEQCELSIHDNGIGFDEKYLDKIFAVFQRLHGRNEYEGTGVGLAVCRRITDRHGGTITARSKQGEGATFIVTVPVRHPNKELAP